MATKRLIDANDAIERAKASDKIVKSSIRETGEVIEFLEDCPIVDAVEVVHGEWIDESWGDWRCSSCRRLYTFDDYGDVHPLADCGYNYCPNCGAKMDGDGNE